MLTVFVTQFRSYLVSAFRHNMHSYPLHIVNPAFDSDIVESMFALEILKARHLVGTTHLELFFQIKDIFHLLESLGSARIEGNRTTIDELVEQQIEGHASSEPLREIENIEDAMLYIEREFEKDPQRRIDAPMICELHRLVVQNLCPTAAGGEGDERPGRYRSRQVWISNANHVPPSPQDVAPLMGELVDFMNAAPRSREDLLRIAIAHHRFTYIHPFTNGNGRVVRLLTYAMLIRTGFRVSQGRILNPTAVFCHDRNAYMRHLSVADTGTDEALLQWCSFMIDGLRREMERIDTLLDVQTLNATILIPAIQGMRGRGVIGVDEMRILLELLKHQVVDASFFRGFYPGKSAASISQVIARYKRDKLIRPYPEKRSRSYVLNLHGPLLHDVMRAFDHAGFLPPST